MWCMHRTNLYLTEEQEKRLDARAKTHRISRSAYVRRIIDRVLDEPEPLRPEVEVQLREFADVYLDVAGDLFEGDPDLSIDP